MKITIVGTGYVGLVTGTCFSQMGNDVCCVDIDAKRIDNLKKGIIPIYERGLEELVIKNFKEGRLTFSTNLSDCINDSLFIFIAVGTPPNEDGSADLKHVLKVAQQIGEMINEYKIIINKSTVPVGTAEKVKNTIAEKLKERNVNIEFDVVSNPEFLKEGDAVNDFMSPDRVIVGTSSIKAQEYMKDLYSAFFKQHPRIIFMDEKSAEVTKYASNAMLATKISFMNDMANFCEKAGADIEMVRLGIGADKRIGYSFIYPGIGYGGSCFPKDVKAIIKTAKDLNYDMRVLNAVEEVNNAQKHIIFKKIKKYYEAKNTSLDGKVIAIWGLSFKPETDDMREAPSIITIRNLVSEGAFIHAHDPKAIDEAKKIFKDISDRIKYFDNNYDCLEGADAMALLTEWFIYRQPDFKKIKNKYNIPVIFDGRNQYDIEELKKIGIEYYCVGRNS
jgi:UDPglucose 6-dehydrogenase